MEIEVGDKIRVVGESGFYHYGIYVGPRGPYGADVVHNAKGGQAEFVHFDGFAAGRPVEIAKRSARSLGEQEAIVRRALSLIGRRYDLVNFNCEHFVNYVTEGVPQSPTLARFVVLGLLGLVVWAAAQRG